MIPRTGFIRRLAVPFHPSLGYEVLPTEFIRKWKYNNNKQWLHRLKLYNNNNYKIIFLTSLIIQANLPDHCYKKSWKLLECFHGFQKYNSCWGKMTKKLLLWASDSKNFITEEEKEKKTFFVRMITENVWFITNLKRNF